MVKVHHFDDRESGTLPASFQKIATDEKQQVSSLRKLFDDPDQAQAAEKAVTLQREFESRPSEMSSPSVNYGNAAHPQINQIYKELSGPDSEDG